MKPTDLNRAETLSYWMLASALAVLMAAIVSKYYSPLVFLCIAPLGIYGMGYTRGAVAELQRK